MARIVEILRSHRHVIREDRPLHDAESLDEPAPQSVMPDDGEDEQQDQDHRQGADESAVAQDEPADGSSGYFIEVGFPDKHIEGSPEVMAVSAPEVALPPPAATRDGQEGEVYFEAWPLVTDDSADPPAPELVVFHDPESPSARQFTALYEQLHKQVAGGKVVAFTPLLGSPWHLAVDVLLNLAAVAANSGKKTLVVELDIDDYGICRRLATPRTNGLLNVVAGGLALEEAIRPTAIAHLAVLPPGMEASPAQSTGELGRAIEWVLDWAQARFDLVFVHVPESEVPLGLAAYCRAIDCILPVAVEHSGKSSEIRSLVRELRTIEMVVPGILYQRAKSA